MPGQCLWGCSWGDEAGGGSVVGAAAPQGPWDPQPPTAAPARQLKRRDAGGLQRDDGSHAVREGCSQSGVHLPAWDCGELEQTRSSGSASALPRHPREWRQC